MVSHSDIQSCSGSVQYLMHKFVMASLYIPIVCYVLDLGKISFSSLFSPCVCALGDIEIRMLWI